MILLTWGLLGLGSILLLLVLFGNFDLGSEKPRARLFLALWSGLLFFALGAAALYFWGS